MKIIILMLLTFTFCSCQTEDGQVPKPKRDKKLDIFLIEIDFLTSLGFVSGSFKIGLSPPFIHTEN